MRTLPVFIIIGLAAWNLSPTFATAQAADKELIRLLTELDPRVFPADSDTAKELPAMVSKQQRLRTQDANLADYGAWSELKSRADWLKFIDVRLRALRESLGQFPPVPRNLKIRVTKTLKGDGFHIDNLVFESRPGLIVTANLYVPADPPKSMPGILIVHSHHNSRTQGELQDMGMTWARQGCLVLIMDQLGHGERRQHPFVTDKDYSAPFKAGRQDYYFRFNEGMQLQLIGDSLMGWMVWDLISGVDLLLARPGIDENRIMLFGSVAGGGDPAAVAAALDPRIVMVAPFNFGGPQPDFSIPADPKRNFNVFGHSDWETTRCLRLGAKGGFSQWMIVASVAPRRLIYSHEFAWDHDRDPVFARLQKIYGWYDAGDNLAIAYGQGNLQGKPPESSHCNNIGPLHRSKMYPTLKKWFDLPIPTEYTKRFTSAELAALTPESAKDIKMLPLHQLAAQLAAERSAAARARLMELNPQERKDQLRKTWAKLLGDIQVRDGWEAKNEKVDNIKGIRIERISLKAQGITIPILLLQPRGKVRENPPLVLAVAQEGKQGFLKNRAGMIARLLENGSAVCLVDVRGTGETSPGSSRRHTSAATSRALTENLFGDTMLGARLRDVRLVLHYLRGRDNLDATRTVLWGDSFAAVNSKEANLAVPLEVDPFPAMAEPLGGLLAMFTAFYEDDVRAVYIRGGLSSYQSLLQSPFIYVPGDAILPGVLQSGDISDLAAGLSPRPLRLEQFVDGMNRAVTPDELSKIFARETVQIVGEPSPDAAAEWILTKLQKGK